MMETAIEQGLGGKRAKVGSGDKETGYLVASEKLKRLICGSLVVGSLLIALSRYDDYWHHWQDIVVGTLLGHVCCYAAFRLRFPSPINCLGLMPHSRAGAPGESSGKHHLSPPSESVV